MRTSASVILLALLSSCEHQRRPAPPAASGASQVSRQGARGRTAGSATNRSSMAEAVPTPAAVCRQQERLTSEHARRLLEQHRTRMREGGDRESPGGGVAVPGSPSIPECIRGLGVLERKHPRRYPGFARCTMSSRSYEQVVGCMQKLLTPPVPPPPKPPPGEPTAALERIETGARHYYLADHYDAHGRLLASRFPPSIDWTPARACCTQPNNECPPDPAQWQRPTWLQLHFGIEKPHRFQYRFTSSGAGRKATYIAEARGDRDCDGVYSIFQIEGSVDASSQVTTRSVVRNAAE